jgi:serine protease
VKPLHLGVALAVIVAGCQSPATMAPPTAESFVSGQVLVRFEPETGEATRAALREKYGARDVSALPSGTEQWHVSGAPRELSGAIARETGVEAAEPNWIRRLQAFAPQDLDYAGTTKKQWHLLSDYLDMAQIWESSRYTLQVATGQDVIIAVVDSGVDMSHPDLAANIVKAGGQQASIDLVDDNNKAPKLDGNGHGTHVAGILAAVSDSGTHGGTSTYNGEKVNSGNIVGVAPNAKLLPVQVMRGDGGGNDFSIAKGIEKAVDWKGDNGIGVDLINLSIGGPEPSSALAAALGYAAKKGVLVIAAAGNSGSPVMYPAAYPGALAVGALNPQNKRAAYSCYGPQLGIVAPGGADPHEPDEAKGSWQGIYSTFPSYHALQGGNSYTGTRYYEALSGTSMATPVVTGVAALVLAQAKSQGQRLTPDQLKMRLVATAQDIGTPGFDNLTGWGKIDPKRALDWVTHDGVTP